MKRDWKGYFAAAAGICLLAAGIWLLKSGSLAQGAGYALPYVLVGLGCGAFGQGMGTLVNARVLKGNPELAKQARIDAQDERNLAIAHAAKARAFDMMTYLFGALMVAFALMEIDFAAVLLLVAAYLLVEGYGLYIRFQLEKEM